MTERACYVNYIISTAYKMDNVLIRLIDSDVRYRVATYEVILYKGLRDVQPSWIDVCITHAKLRCINDAVRITVIEINVGPKLL